MKKMRKALLLLVLIVLSSQPLLSSSLALAEVVATSSTSQASQLENGKVKSTAAATIKVNPLTIYVGQTFTATEMVESAVNGDGLPIDFSNLTITGADKVDTSKPGSYTLGFSYEGSDPVYNTLTVEARNRISPLASSQSATAGYQLISNNLVVLQATTDDPNPDYSQVDFSGQTASGTRLNPDSPVVGTYNVTATYQDASTSFELVVKEDRSELILNQIDLTVDLDDTSQLKTILNNPYRIITSYKDTDGNSQTPSKDNVTVKKSKNLSTNPTVGTYTITYSGTNGKKVTLTIHVTGNKIQLVPQDVELIVGDFFDKASGLKSATDIHGNALDVATSITNKTIKESDEVDTSKPGFYTVTYSYYGVTTTANVTVKSNSNYEMYVDKSKLTRYQNDDFNATDLLAQVIYNGKVVDKTQVTAIYDASKINTVGTFNITYTYKELTKNVTINVNEDKSLFSLNDGSDILEKTAYTNSYNEPFSQLKIQDPSGKSIGAYTAIKTRLSGLNLTTTVTEGKIIPHQWAYVEPFNMGAGTVVYTLTYRGHKVTITYHVLESQTDIKAKDTTLALDSDTWKVDDNFVSATTYDGKDAKYDSVDGIVPTDASGVVNKLGVYQVKYSIYGDAAYGTVSTTATIRVVKDQSKINLKARTIYSGDSWKGSDQFVSGLTKTGETLSKDDVATDVANTSGKPISYTITDSEAKQLDTIDNTKSGKYTITYQYGAVTQSTTLTVVTYTPTINVHNSSIFVGSGWTAANNFDLAYTAAGKRLAISDLAVDSSAVDLNTPGVYQVKYTYGETTATAELTVKERHLGINVHDSKIVIGSSWSASDNFDSASDSDGNTVTFDQLTTSITDEAGKAVNTIDTSKAGTYTVTCDYTDSTNTSTQSTAKVTIYSAADLKVTNVRIPINTEWDPSLAFIAATSPSGDSQTWDQIKDNVTITGTVDPSVAKSYSLTYAYEGITKEVQVTVVGERTLTVPKSTDFGSVTLGPISSALNLTYPGGDIKVEDSVENSKGWILTAKVSDSTSDFNQYLMNGDKTLTQNSKLGSATSGGTTTVSEGWQGTKKGLWIDYSTAQKVRTDDVKIRYTLTPSNSEVAE